MNPSDTLMLFGDMTFNSALLLIVKLFFLVGGLLYLVFAFVVVRQIAIMKRTLITPLSPLVTTLGYIHLLVAAGAIVLFLMML